MSSSSIRTTRRPARSSCSTICRSPRAPIRSSSAWTSDGSSPDIVGAQLARGLFNFNGRFTGSSFGDFLLGMTSSRQFSTVQRGDLRERDYMFYVQDDWRVVPRLTLNLGLRYELASPKFDTQDRMTSLDLSAFPRGARGPGRESSGRSWSDRALVADRHEQLGAADRACLPAGVTAGRSAPPAASSMARRRGAGSAVHLLNNWPQSREVTVPSTATRSAGQLADGIDQSLLGSADRDAGQPGVERLERRFHVADDLPVEPECAAAAGPVVGGDDRLRRVIVAPSPAPVQHQRRRPGRRRTERERRMIPSLGAITMTESSGIRQLPRAGNHGREAAEPRRAGLALVHLEPFDRRRHRTVRRRRQHGHPGLAQHPRRSRATRASTAAIGWSRTRSWICRSAPAGAGWRAEASSARCSATGRCRRSCRCSRRAWFDVADSRSGESTGRHAGQQRVAA